MSHRLRILPLILAMAVELCHAQTNPNTEIGILPYESADVSDVDTVGLFNGSLSVRIPILNFPERGSLKYLLQYRYDGKHFDIHQICDIHGSHDDTDCITSWVAPTKYGDLFLSLEDTANSISAKIVNNWFSVSIVDANGSSHPAIPVNRSSGFQYAAIDGSGGIGNFTVESGGVDPPIAGFPRRVLNRNGTSYSVAGQQSPIVFEDVNGNMISNTSEIYTDTMNRSFDDWAEENPGNVDPTCYGGGSATITSYPGPNGSTQVKVCTLSLATGTTSFNAVDEYGNPIKELTTGPFPGITSISVFDGNSWATSPTWQFQYNDSYGDLTQITFPEGGTISYSWVTLSDPEIPPGTPGVAPVSRYVQSRTIDAQDGTGPQATQYSYNNHPVSNGNPNYSPAHDPITAWDTIVTNPNGDYTVHEFSFLIYVNGRYETETRQYNSSGQLLQTIDTDYQANSDTSGDPNVFPIRKTTIYPGSIYSKVETDYDNQFNQNGAAGYGLPNFTGSYGKPVQVREYDSGIGTPGAIIRCTAYNYKAFQNDAYLAANLIDLVSSKSVYAGSCGSGGQLIAQTTYGYDEQGVQSSGITMQHDTTISSPGVRGNLTSTHQFQLNPSGPTLNTSTTYYDTGLPYLSTDAKGNQTSYIYGPAYYGVYLTQTILPQTSGVQHQIKATYDINTGSVTSYTDQNNQVSNYGYDALGRIWTAHFPDAGSSAASSKVFCYPNLNTGTEVDAQSSALTAPANSLTCPSAPNAKVLTHIFDGLGRVSKAQVLESAQQSVTTDTTYDNVGRVYSVSNPYRSLSDTTYGLTIYTYDALNRKVTQTQPDQSTLQWCYNEIGVLGSIRCLANQSRIPGASWVNSIDESGHLSQHVSDGLGRLVAVMEQNPTGSNLALETDYGYDALDNLKYVNQIGSSANADTPRTRSFGYNSISRLLWSQNPETGVVCYGHGDGSVAGCQADGYDANGNLIYKTDGRGITTNYTYDNLNRMLSKTYLLGGSSPNLLHSCYLYDSATNGIGRLWLEWTTAGSCSTAGYQTMRQLLAYDPMGRAWNEQQCVFGHCTSGPPPPTSCTANGNSAPYYQTYCYDLAGNMTWSVNGVSNTPSVNPVAFSYTFDAVGRLSTLSSSWIDSVYPPILHPPALFTADPTSGYSPAGALQNYTLGNSVSVTNTYDNRLRTTSDTATQK